MIDFDVLVTWLRAQVDEDERVALAATASPWVGCFKQVTSAATDPEAEVAGTQRAQTADHIARHDPTRVLAEVAAKRRIIGNCEEIINGTGWPGLAYITLRLLTLPYVDQPGYRAEWAP